MTEQTREAWLQAAANELGQVIYNKTGVKVPPVYVSVGFTGHQCKIEDVLGACWAAESSVDGQPHIFISPINAAPVDSEQGILSTLVHELIHAAVEKKGHGYHFQKLAKKVGLEKPWPRTKAGPALQVELVSLAQDLGEFPHSPLKLGEKTKRIKTAEIMLGTKLGAEARIVIPSEDQFGQRLSAEFLTKIFHEAAELFGGYTSFNANGGYILANGKLLEEPSTVLDIAMHNSPENKIKLEAFADQLRIAGNQETVYLRLPSGKVELIGGGE